MSQNLGAEKTNLVRLIEILSTLEVNSKLAKINETSISDNNGGRIEL